MADCPPIQRMPAKQKTYRHVKFRAEDLRRAVAGFLAELENVQDLRRHLSVAKGDTEWNFSDDDEAFYPHYSDPAAEHANFNLWRPASEFIVRYSRAAGTEVTVALPGEAQVERVFAVFEGGREAGAEPYTRPRPHIFLGHGKSDAWQELQHYLKGEHGFDVFVYEIGGRSNYTIREFLCNVRSDAAFAVLVQTAEDDARTRDSAIHELGLFQGRLGFGRAMLLTEVAFPELAGVRKIASARGGMRETFGEVLAVLRRELDLEE